MGTPEKENHIYRFMREQPVFGRRVFVHPRALVSGAVQLGDDVSVWPMTVIRGDVNRITVGPRCNIQDACVLHVSHERARQPEGGPLVLGADVSIAHGVILHACTIGDRCLVGMGAVVMDGAVVEEDALVAGGAVVTPGTRVPSRTLWRGNPARYARDLDDREVADLAYNAAHYVRLKDLHLQEPA